MTIRHLKIFVSVYQHMSITQAADELHIAQPSVSLAIKELENNYHLKLFDRISRRISPTDAGHRFYSYAIHIVSLFDQMESDAISWSGTDTIRIGSSITIGNELLPSLIADFQTSHPENQVQVEIKNTETITQYILDNKVDFGLVEGAVNHNSIQQVEFMDDHLSLIAAYDHPLTHSESVTLQDTAQYPFLLREPGSAGRDIIDSVYQSRGILIQPVWESISNHALIEGVIHNLGISILPYRILQNAIAQKQIQEIPLTDCAFSRSFSIIYHKNKYLSPSCQDFIAQCKRQRL